MFRSLALLALSALLAGCVSVNPMRWFDSEKPATPPAALTEVANQIQPRVLWQANIGGGADDKLLKLEPAIHDGRVYLANAQGQVEARNAANGALHWRLDTNSPASGGPGAGEGLVVIGTHKAEVIALDAAKGTKRWQARVSSEVLSVPRIGRGLVVVHTLDGKLVALDAASGEQRWQYGHEVPVLSLRGNSSPVIHDGSVICGFANGKLASLDLASGNLNWEVSVGIASGRTELDRMTDIDADPLVLGDRIYVVTFQGDLAALSVSDGAVLWRQKLSSYSGLGGDGHQLYVTDAQDQVRAFDPQSSNHLWKQSKMQYRRLSAPTPFGGYVVAGDYQGYLHWLRPEDGSLVARTRLGSSAITARPKVRDNRLYVYGDGGDFAVIGLGN
ncbi:outer membrane protein assembly factor BamB [Magnetovirga frankeli]|uniref:outer membrane protein assembly factor BamB n=1 Tax=Magnetovirga frankeli TaxID=947516 RepID=UPI003D335007